MISFESSPGKAIGQSQLNEFLDRVADEWLLRAGVQRALLLPPDHTRLHSRAGEVTAELYRRVSGQLEVDVMPTLGTHQPMTQAECQLMFGDAIPLNKIIPHRWRDDLTQLGEINAEDMHDYSMGKFSQPMRVEVNRRLVSGEYDAVLSIGQVVPHEVMGLANYTKNICIGAGGKDVIHKSHFLSAVCGMEAVMGQRDPPVRKMIDRVYEAFIRPRCEAGFVLTVVEESPAAPLLRGVYAGRNRDAYEAAAALSQQVNIHQTEPLERCVVLLDPHEFHSTWLGNKAIYRTRMAMADNGELHVIAPGVRRFGEDAEIDALIREHGYCGTEATLAAVHKDPALGDNLSAAAHLIHGSSESRFRIIYYPGDGLSESEIRQVGFEFGRLEAAHQRFGLADGERPDGWYEDVEGDRFYLINNPGLGLWQRM